MEESIPQLIPNNSQSSVAIKKTTKGYTWDVKVYDENVENALNTAMETEAQLVEKYGTSNDSPKEE